MRWPVFRLPTSTSSAPPSRPIFMAMFPHARGARHSRTARSTLSLNEADLPPNDVRVPDERARLRADEGDARVARIPRGARARAGRPDPFQHLLDPRVGR